MCNVASILLTALGYSACVNAVNDVNKNFWKCAKLPDSIELQALCHVWYAVLSSSVIIIVAQRSVIPIRIRSLHVARQYFQFEHSNHYELSSQSTQIG